MSATQSRERIRRCSSNPVEMRVKLGLRLKLALKGSTCCSSCNLKTSREVDELRQKLLEEHFAFLDRRKDKVLVAGSVREIPSDRPLGGLWDHRSGARGGGARYL